MTNLKIFHTHHVFSWINAIGTHFRIFNVFIIFIYREIFKKCFGKFFNYWIFVCDQFVWEFRFIWSFILNKRGIYLNWVDCCWVSQPIALNLGLWFFFICTRYDRENFQSKGHFYFDILFQKTCWDEAVFCLSLQYFIFICKKIYQKQDLNILDPFVGVFF